MSNGGTLGHGANEPYASRHLASNGALPQGLHPVLLTYGPEGADFTSPGAQSSRGTVDQLVLFPGTAELPLDEPRVEDN